VTLAIVTLSRQLASGGDVVAREVAQVLGLRVVDQHIISQAAIEAGVPRVAVEELGYEGQRGLVERMLGVVYGMPAISTALESPSKDAPIASAMPGGFFSPLRPPMDISMRGYVRVVGMVIRKLAQDGNVIVVGQGGQVVLQDVPDVLHVQVIAPFARRVVTLMAREKLERQGAISRLRASDRARADYLQRYHGVNWLDPMLYDLVINTDHLSLPAATAAVIGACRTLNKRDDNVVLLAEMETEPEGQS
jgi:cytidylate kinase